MTTKELLAPASVRKRTMKGIIFSALESGQRTKHENELRRMGFDVETRDFHKSAYNLAAYDIVFIVKDFTESGQQEGVQDAAKQQGKPWLRVTKKTSNTTWEAVREFAKRHGLEPVGDVDSHPPSLSTQALGDRIRERLAAREEDDSWEELAHQYEKEAAAAKQQASDLESELKELRARETTNAPPEVQRLQDELRTTQAQLKAVRAGLQASMGRSIEDFEALERKLKSNETMLHTARKERDELKGVVTGLQDEIDKLTKQLNERRIPPPPGSPMIVTVGAAPMGKKLVPANIVATVEKLWSLVGDGVLEADEAIEKILVQLKGE